jgi:hypothetical protein
MKPAVGMLLLLGTVPFFAQDAPPLEPATLLTISGEKTWAIGIDGQAVSFHLRHPHPHVTISARLGNGGGHAFADAYLMKEIGPGTTERDEIARLAFDLVYPFEGWVDLFQDLDLEAGTYWLVIARPPDKAHTSINWFVAQPLTTSGSCSVAYVDSKSYSFQSDAAEYIPASKFEKKYQPYGFQFEVWEMRAPGGEACP